MLNEQSHIQPVGLPPEFDARMSAIEDYMASNDEYIIEAARQAAEAVLEAHTRNNLAQTASPADMVLLSELANDLRKLEGLSRNTDERTHRTFEALHETLLQIASRLDVLDQRHTQGQGPSTANVCMLLSLSSPLRKKKMQLPRAFACPLPAFMRRAWIR